jgi:prepilin-type N-terminal cleavage/methylation domain-containing protein
MILHSLKSIIINQRGITLIEVLVAVAISSIITGGITMTTLQVISGSAHTSNHSIIITQVQNAGYWVSHDAQMAQIVEITSQTGFPLTLTWTDWDAVTYQSFYSFDGNKLKRVHTEGGVPETTYVAEFIDPNETKIISASITPDSGCTYSLPDITDAFTITDGVGGNAGTITVTAGNISVTETGNATYNAGSGVWTTPSAGDTIIVTATDTDTIGSCNTDTGKTATIGITADSNDNATITTSSVFIFKITATTGDVIETRTYRIDPRPKS